MNELARERERWRLQTPPSINRAREKRKRVF
jgi:hypothetical protein